MAGKKTEVQELELEAQEANQVKAADTLVEYAEQEVELYVPINYNDPENTDITIQVNGVTILVKRGEHVKVKRKFAEAYRNSEVQMGKALALINELSQ